MANEFYTPEQAAQVAASLANEDALLSALVSRNFQNDLMGGGKGGAPVGIKMPTTLIARSRNVDDVTTEIVLDEIREEVRTVNLDRKHDYSAVGLSEADLTLNIKEYAAQVLKPQAEAVVDILEHKVATALASVPLTDLGVFDEANPVPYFTRLRKMLRENGVPASGLNVVVGVDVYAALLDAKAITDASESGSTAALRDAQVGRLRGFTVVESTRVGATEVMAFHRDAVTLVTRAPVAPAGAPFAATVAEKGFSLRYLRDYDSKVAQDRSMLSTFSGVGILPTYKIERDYETRQVKVTEIDNGGVIHADVAETDGGAGA